MILLDLLLTDPQGVMICAEAMGMELAAEQAEKIARHIDEEMATWEKQRAIQIVLETLQGCTGNGTGRTNAH